MWYNVIRNPQLQVLAGAHRWSPLKITILPSSPPQATGGIENHVAGEQISTEGDVDDVFYRYQNPRSEYSADQLAEMIKSFCVEVEREISELESYSKPPKIDFVKTSKMARSIKARSIMIGAKNVRGGCIYVIDACLVFDEESLSDAVVGLCNDFKRTKKRFETYLEMWNGIVEKEKQLGEPKK